MYSYDKMTTIVEKTKDRTIYRAAKTYPVPDVDVLTLLFGMLELHREMSFMAHGKTVKRINVIT